MNATRHSRLRRVAALSHLAVTEAQCTAFVRNFERLIGEWEALESTPAGDPYPSTLAHEQQESSGLHMNAPTVALCRFAQAGSLQLACGT